jgi:hypothetical protein
MIKNPVRLHGMETSVDIDKNFFFWKIVIASQ